MAGLGFIVGKLASCAAVALTFGYYLFPGYARYLAAAAVIAFMTLNYFGVKKTAGATKVVVTVVVLSLVAIVVLILHGTPTIANLQPLYGSGGLYGILQSAGIWFFAFAGYSRIATLGEEVRNPETSIPRAILISLSLTFLIYAAVVLAALLVLGPATLASSTAPLVTAVQEAGFAQWRWLVQVGSVFATLGVLLSLMAGTSRTIFAMAADHNLPSFLARVHPTYKVPHLAEITVGLILVAVILLADVRSAIGFSSFTVLLYYAITNASARTLKLHEQLFNRSLPVLGLAGCLVLAFALPLAAVIVGGAVMLFGILVYTLRQRPRRA